MPRFPLLRVLGLDTCDIAEIPWVSNVVRSLLLMQFSDMTQAYRRLLYMRQHL